MDIRMTGIDGLEATRRIVARGITTRVLVLTTFDADDHIYETRPSMGQTWDGEVGTSRISHLLIRARGAARRFAPRRFAPRGGSRLKHRRLHVHAARVATAVEGADLLVDCPG
jgi:CheY-like chemotaxis protein